eukprot:GHVU01149016.1.p1 GENE.GHVU01149016.1~~GHVU01149016.1.p1  ORF type:complete len:102 (+),score=4.14 GHVU01149016.1:136-441(+)
MLVLRDRIVCLSLISVLVVVECIDNDSTAETTASTSATSKENTSTAITSPTGTSTVITSPTATVNNGTENGATYTGHGGTNISLLMMPLIVVLKVADWFHL